MDLWSHILVVICAVLLFSALQVVSLSLALKRKREERAILEMKRQEMLSEHTIGSAAGVSKPSGVENTVEPVKCDDVCESFRQLLMSDREEFGKLPSSDILSKLKLREGQSLGEADRRAITIGIYDSFDDVIRKLYDILPDIKKADIDTCMLSYLGCDNDVIAEIECVSAGAIRQRKSRLARRIPSDIYNLMV